MPTTQEWIDWAKTRTREDLGSGLEASNRTAFVYYSALVTRRLRDADAPTDAGTRWSSVNELANADHYWFSRYVVFMAACLGHAPIGAASARRSPVLRLVLPLIRSLGGGDRPAGRGRSRRRPSSDSRRRHERDDSTFDPFDWAADRIEGVDVAVRGAGDTLAAGTAAMAAGGTAVIWSALIPMWAAYKSVVLGLGLPGLVPGNDGFDGAPSSDPTAAQMQWAYVGINDAINDDFNYCWQWLGSTPLDELLPEGFDMDNLLRNLPASASPAGGA